MTFSSALIAFTLILTPLYLIILLYSEKARRRGRARARKEALSNIQKVLVFSLVLTEIVAMPLLFTPWFQATHLSFILVVSIACFLLCALWLVPDREKIKGVLLLSTIFFHLVVLNLLPLPHGIMITEKSAATARLASEGKWNVQWRYINPYYNPFPTDIALLVITSELTSIGYIDMRALWVIGLFFTVAFDLTLYILAKKLSGSWRAGVFGIFLLALTPPTAINFQPEFLADLLLLVCMLALIKAFSGSHHVPNIIVANISFLAAIFFHAAAGLGIFLLLYILVLSYLNNKIWKAKIENLYKNQLLRTTIVTFTVIMLARWIYTAGVFESLVDHIKFFTIQLLGYRSEWIGAQYTPLYDQFVSPLNAYAWSTSISMASALALCYFINKKSSKPFPLLKTITLALFIGAASFLLVGLIGGLFAPAMGFQRYIGYHAFIFILPIAAIVGAKVLRASKTLGAVIIVLMLLFIGTGITDPSISPQLHKSIKSVNPATTKDYLEAHLLYGVLIADTNVVASYEMLVSLSYLEVTEGKTLSPYSVSLKVNRIMIDRAIEYDEVLSGAVYIWSSDINPHLVDLTVNVFYSSGRHVAFEKAE